MNKAEQLRAKLRDRAAKQQADLDQQYQEEAEAIAQDMMREAEYRADRYGIESYDRTVKSHLAERIIKILEANGFRVYTSDDNFDKRLTINW